MVLAHDMSILLVSWHIRSPTLTPLVHGSANTCELPPDQQQLLSKVHEGGYLRSKHLLLVLAGHRNYGLMTFGNSVLAGLVAITSGCSTVWPWGAICIGVVSGILYNIGSMVRLMIWCCQLYLSLHIQSDSMLKCWKRVCFGSEYAVIADVLRDSQPAESPS